MKKFFLFAVALVGTMLAHAQLSDGVSATLQAGETTTVFYGSDAFKDAISAAPNADGVITLSPGAFANPGVISKSLKIYGAGFLKDEANNIAETRVIGDLTITSTDDITPVVRAEGVYFSGNVVVKGTQAVKNTEIVKCSFARFYNSVETNNTTIRQNYAREGIYGEDKLATSFLVTNCWVPQISGFTTACDITVTNCILSGNCTHSYALYRNNLINRYYYNWEDRRQVESGSSCYNNVGHKYCLERDGDTTCDNNYYINNNWGEILKDGQANLNFFLTDTSTPRTWELADPTTYVGTDGTPCGVTGGDFPWNPVPATPRIISTSVDAKTTPGTLKVSIKAEARPIE